MKCFDTWPGIVVYTLSNKILRDREGSFVHQRNIFLVWSMNKNFYSSFEDIQTNYTMPSFKKLAM